ncbi:hypothetical protein [Streptomyces sp. NPDC102437]|uniref:hypothetical protein n=1 Tax=Streptomyces sp. NPDC102437 TaxID=3366175 RepID=UPI0038241B7D
MADTSNSHPIGHAAALWRIGPPATTVRNTLEVEMLTKKRAARLAATTALVTALALGGSAGIAFADDGSGNDDSSSSAGNSDTGGGNTDEDWTPGGAMQGGVNPDDSGAMHGGVNPDDSGAMHGGVNPDDSGATNNSGNPDNTQTYDQTQVHFYSISVPNKPRAQEDKLAEAGLDTINCAKEKIGLQKAAGIIGAAYGPVAKVVLAGSKYFVYLNDIELVNATHGKEKAEYQKRLILDIRGERGCYTLGEKTLSGAYK